MKHGKKMMYGGKKKMMAGGKAKPMMKNGGAKKKKGLKALAASGPKGKAAVKKMGFNPAELKKGGMVVQKAMNGLMKAIKAQDKVMKKMMGGYGKKK
tara:strand:+ start:239 stop:529 length:291 start_codon:yes stop_codon:yes gene_type:complete